MRKNESGSRNYDWLDSSQLKIRKCFEEKKGNVISVYTESGENASVAIDDD